MSNKNNEILASAGEGEAAGDVNPDGARISGLETTAPAASGSPAAALDVGRPVRPHGSGPAQLPSSHASPAADPIRDAVAKARGRTLAVDDIPTLNKIAAAMQAPAADPLRFIDKDAMRRKIADDPDLPCEAGSPAAPVCEWAKDVQFKDAYSTACGYVTARLRTICVCAKTVHLKSEAAR